MNKVSISRYPDVFTRVFSAADPSCMEIVLGDGLTRVGRLEGHLPAAYAGAAEYRFKYSTITSRSSTRLLALPVPMTSRAFYVTYEVRSGFN